MRVCTHARLKARGHDSSCRQIKTEERIKARKRLTAESEDVTVHFIPIAFKQLGGHVHHLLQGLHLYKRTQKYIISVEMLLFFFFFSFLFNLCGLREDSPVCYLLDRNAFLRKPMQASRPRPQPGGLQEE